MIRRIAEWWWRRQRAEDMRRLFPSIVDFSTTLNVAFNVAIFHMDLNRCWRWHHREGVREIARLWNERRAKA